MVVIEPELGTKEPREMSLLDGLEITVSRRADVDKGGCDSYVFAEDHAHPLWAGTRPEHLLMFNGALGGEVVSQHHVTTGAPHAVLARCGLTLGVAAVMEIPFGSGRVIVSRLQARGRLVARPGSHELFARRPDPVMQGWMLTLLSYASAPAQP
jgi:hypothetical protein